MSFATTVDMKNSFFVKLNRIGAGFMSFMMLSLMVLSLYFVSAEAGHECEGEHCHICECIEQCCNTVRRMGEGAIRLFTAAITVIFTVLSVTCVERRFSEETLVSKKVRLND